MRLKFIHFGFFIIFCILQANLFITKAMDGTPVIDTEEHFRKCGLTAQPLKLSIKDDITQKCVEEFKEFQTTRHQLRDQVSTYTLIKSYILDTLKISSMDFSLIENWISRPLDGSAVPKRTLSVPLDTLVSLLSLKASQPVFTKEVEDYLAQAQVRLTATKRFGILKSFAINVLHFPLHEMEGLSSWVFSNTCLHAHMDTQKLLKCDFGVVLEVINSRAERNIAPELDGFERDFCEKQERITMREDLEAFIMKSGNAMPMTPQDFGYELLQGHDGIMQQAIPKGIDIACILAKSKHHFLSGLFSGLDNRFRAFGRFIVCRQMNPIPEIHHPDLFKESLVTFGIDGLYQDGKLLTTPTTIFALSPQGELCAFPQSKGAILGQVHHSYFFQVDNIGIPLACAGHVEIQMGKITAINNHSGHFGTTILQLILAVAYFHEKGVVSENLTLAHYSGVNSNLSLGDILSIAKMVQLSN